MLRLTRMVSTAVILAAVLATIAYVAYTEFGEKPDFTAEDHAVWRDGMCIWICESRWAERLSVYEQKLGVGASEWRCGCTDGHVQTIP